MATSRRGWPRWLRWTRDIVLLLLVLWGIQWWQSRDLAGGTAPALSGPDPEGKTLALADYRGQPVLVHFWATWCPVCRMEEGGIERIAQDYPVLTVATSSGSGRALREYLHENGLSFAVIVDESGDLARRWRVRGVPVSYIVDSRGRIAWAGQGYATEPGLRARLWLAD